MALMHVSLAELLCQATMGQIPTLEYMRSGARGLPWPRPIVPDAKCHRFQRPRCWSCLSIAESFPDMLTGRAVPAPGRGGRRDG
jgi:hypothetical protein